MTSSTEVKLWVREGLLRHRVQAAIHVHTVFASLEAGTRSCPVESSMDDVLRILQRELLESWGWPGQPLKWAGSKCTRAGARAQSAAVAVDICSGRVNSDRGPPKIEKERARPLAEAFAPPPSASWEGSEGQKEGKVARNNLDGEEEKVREKLERRKVCRRRASASVVDESKETKESLLRARPHDEESESAGDRGRQREAARRDKKVPRAETFHEKLLRRRSFLSGSVNRLSTRAEEDIRRYLAPRTHTRAHWVRARVVTRADRTCAVSPL